jgi:hypothetical protein
MVAPLKRSRLGLIRDCGYVDGRGFMTRTLKSPGGIIEAPQ